MSTEPTTTTEAEASVSDADGDSLTVRRTGRTVVFYTDSESGIVALNYAAALRIHDALGRMLGLSTPTPTAPLTASRAAAHRAKPKAAVTHCPQGHPYDEANTRYDTVTGARRCRICRSEQTRASLARRNGEETR